jgi:hypothetical protein
MGNVLPDTRFSFRAYFIRMHGPECDFTVRMLLVETTRGKTIYEGIGSWLQCERWIAQISGWIIPVEKLVLVRKCIEQKRLAAIDVVRISVEDIESVGLIRVDQ